MDSTVARDWLAALARSANDKDYDAHMGLISRDVKVFGVPGFEVIGYDDWARQCAHEFAQGIFARVDYQGMKVLAIAPGRVMFKTLESVQAGNGEVQTQGVEIVIAREADGQWRVIQERILSPEEAAFDQLEAQ